MQLDFFPPKTTWTVPTELPDWRGEDLIAIDTETRDDGLKKEHGPGWALPNSGYICGVAMATLRHGSIYVPTQHPDSSNFDRDRVRRWLDAHLKCGATIVFHNAPYDLGWIQTDFGINTDNVKYHDTHAMAVMLDENRRSYALDKLCLEAGVPRKDERILREAAACFRLDPKADLYKLPASFVGDYAAQDAESTLILAKHMLPKLDEQNLGYAYKLEMDLIPMVMAMRRRGCLIDQDRCEVIKAEFTADRDRALEQVRELIGQRRAVDIEDCNSPRWMEMVFDSLGIKYPRTPKANRGQFQSKWLEKHEHPFPRLIATARKFHDAGHKFIENYVQSFLYNGRIHAEIHQLRDDDGGTRSYRFSYSNPPLQQVPARDPDLGPKVRSVFLPENGTQWGSIDLSGQEPAMTVHYAVEYKTVGHKAAQQYYHNTAKPDYHQMTADITGIPRKPAKIINLSLAYGMGIPELCNRLGVSLEEGTAMAAIYNERMPFIRQLTKILGNEAQTLGYVVLIDGARCRFDNWEPAGSGYGNKPLPRAEAESKWPNAHLQRAGTHKALNRKIQGSSARQLKMIMRECWRNGDLPQLTYHDELAFSLVNDTMTKRIVHTMTHTLQLNVPTRADVEIGPNWGASMS